MSKKKARELFDTLGFKVCALLIAKGNKTSGQNIFDSFHLIISSKSETTHITLKKMQEKHQHFK